MIKLIGLILLIPAGWFLYKAIKAPPVRLGKGIQLFPMYVIMFFVTVIAIAALTIGAPRTAVYIHGAPEDVASYTSLFTQLSNDYVISALDTYGKPKGAFEIVSCNETTLQLFADKAEAKTSLIFVRRTPPTCSEMSVIANFFHPRIDLYLR